jgi:plasmid stabilization system protein ParE
MPTKSNFTVKWTATAEHDLDAIIGFIAEDAPGEAMSILEKVRRKTLGLHILPERGRIVPELKEQGIILYREIIVTPWRIMYRISGHTVYVLAVIDARRNVEDILLDRFVG